MNNYLVIKKRVVLLHSQTRQTLLIDMCGSNFEKGRVWDKIIEIKETKGSESLETRNLIIFI
ncbi:MAG: hypothetical protein WCR29_01465, partial [Bacteroidales bacterium]